MSRRSDISIFGAGAWGTALALIAARAGRSVSLWAREPEVVESIARTRQNGPFLPGIVLPPMACTGDMEAATAGAQALLVVVPAQHLRASLLEVSLHAAAGIPLVICAKGFERTSGKLVTEVFDETATIFTAGLRALSTSPTPVIVPPVPMPETTMSTLPSVSRQISSAVVLRWISGFAGFLNCCGM